MMTEKNQVMEHPKVIIALADRVKEQRDEWNRMFIKGRNMEGELVKLCKQKYPEKHTVEVSGLLVDLSDGSVRDLDLSEF